MNNIVVLFFGLIFTTSFGVFAQENYQSLRITAFVANQSQFPNEFGDKKDWLEITNITDGKVEITELSLFVTDKSHKRPLQFELPEKTLEVGETWRIWCDAENVYSNQVHTNFKLSKRGEHLALYHKKPNGEVVKVDDWKYFALSKGQQGLRRSIDGQIQPIPVTEPSR